MNKTLQTEGGKDETFQNKYNNMLGVASQCSNLQLYLFCRHRSSFIFDSTYSRVFRRYKALWNNNDRIWFIPCRP